MKYNIFGIKSKMEIVDIFQLKKTTNDTKNHKIQRNITKVSLNKSLSFLKKNKQHEVQKVKLGHISFENNKKYIRYLLKNIIKI